MKSYLLPAIIGAAVIAGATLIYTLLLPSGTLVNVEAPVEQAEVIETPADAQQTKLTPQAEVSDEAENKFKLVIDIARVQADGMAVFAGKGAPNGTIFIVENGAIFAQNTIDDAGQWVVLPEQPLAPGAHLLQLEMVTLDGARERADVSLVVEIAQDGDEKPLVALVPQTDEQSPVLLQSPDEGVKDSEETVVADTATEPEKPLTKAEEVAEILGQEDIFIQIGSLSWSDDKMLFVHGVASGGETITGKMANNALERVTLDKSGRWKTKIIGDPFATGDRQMLEVALRDSADKVLETTSLNISQKQLTAGLDGSMMVVVHKGDALWRIAYRSYGKGVRYVDIFRRNADKIDDPDLIYPNQIFAVPGIQN